MKSYAFEENPRHFVPPFGFASAKRKSDGFAFPQCPAVASLPTGYGYFFGYASKYVQEPFGYASHLFFLANEKMGLKIWVVVVQKIKDRFAKVSQSENVKSEQARAR